jgi:hypothetical protein
MLEIVPNCEEEDMVDDNGSKEKSLPAIPGDKGEEEAVYDNARMLTIN